MPEDKKNKNYSLFLFIFLTSFLLGFIFAFQVADNPKSDLLKNGDKSAIDLGGLVNKNDLDLEKFWDVYNLVKNNNYGLDQVGDEELVDGAIKGLVESLGDQHTEYMSIDDTKKFNEVLSGDFEGIGAVVNKNEFGVGIDLVIKGSPAKKYGLKKGDIIIKSNGFDLAELGLYEAIEKIKGPAGTEANLEVIRAGEKEILNIKVIRDKIKIPSINSELLDSNIGYISINRFGENTSKDFSDSLKDFSDSDGIIIDLRDNGGGYLLSAVEILSEFVEKGEVLVKTKERRIRDNQTYRSFNDGNIFSKKIVVLINENSASASEITAGALSDYNLAILVGKKSYGKGSVQKPFQLNDGSQLKLTVANWYTPNGTNIDKDGITPDIEVDFEKEDFENEYDRQLEVAKEVLQEYINIDSIGIVVDKFSKEEKTVE